MARALLARIVEVPGSTDCKAALLAAFDTAPFDQKLAAWRRLLARVPESVDLRTNHAGTLNFLGRRQEALATLRAGLALSPHPIDALELQLQIVTQYMLLLDSAAAKRLMAGIGTSVSRDGRPYLRLTYLRYVGGHALAAGDHSAWDSLALEGIAIARAAGDPLAEFESVSERGAVLAFQANNPRLAFEPLSRAVFIADSLRAPPLVALAYVKRGRALVRTGDFRAAESDLLTALRAVPPRDATSLAEIHHSLAHVYEGQGKWTQATRQADLYGQQAWEVRRGGNAYMMSLHDAGLIRWKAGWHAAARRSFDQMVSVIEERRTSYFYAGEYYERIGDFASAARYYRRGLDQPDHGERHQNLAGLTRMYEALGFRDSARATARLHDLPGAYAVSPLAPFLLLSDGRVDEALALAHAGVDTAVRKGSPQGMATARLHLARLLLSAGRTADARRHAASAERLASSANLAEERIEAITIQGISQHRERSPLAVATLLRARRLLQVSPTADAELRTENALGDALAAADQPQDALSAYYRAAIASRRVIASYESAIDRARSSERRVMPFEGALRMIVAMPESAERSERLLAWSSWKKDAALSDAGGTPGRGLKRQTIAAAAAALGGAALVDYLVVDTVLYALIITPTRTRVVRLLMSVGSVASLIQALRRPFISLDAGQLDLARARFDLRAAHQLYLGLFAPLEKMLAGIQHVVVVPDGPLYGVPFAALPTTLALSNTSTAYHDARYLVDRFTLTLAASSAEAAGPQRPLAQAPRVLVMQGPVSGGDAEARHIAASWPAGRVAVATGAATTETALRRLSAGRSVLHLAVHAQADETDALSSYLELSRDSTSDGLLHISEIVALGFTGDLVVLTACQTLPGPQFAGSGPFGIAKAFIAAGARNVVATHWPVGESAADVSRTLHRALAAGATPSTALRLAQLEQRQNPLRAHPFYWGGFVLITSAGRRGE